MRRRLGLAAVILQAVSLSACLSGQRFIDVAIERDGTRILQTGYGVDDYLGNTAIWKSLEGESFEPIGTIEPEAADAQKAVLKGKIRIVIFHVKSQIAQAQVDELRLIRLRVRVNDGSSRRVRSSARRRLPDYRFPRNENEPLKAHRGCAGGIR